jgi:hypothetical protein
MARLAQVPELPLGVGERQREQIEATTQGAVEVRPVDLRLLAGMITHGPWQTEVRSGSPPSTSLEAWRPSPIPRFYFITMDRDPDLESLHGDSRFDAIVVDPERRAAALSQKSN